MAYDKVVDSEKLDGALANMAARIKRLGGIGDEITWDETNGFTDRIDDVFINAYNTGARVGRADGIEEGKQAAYDAFWDSFQYNGVARGQPNKFYAWPNEAYKPKFPIHVMANSSSSGILQYSTITDTRVDIIFESGCTVSYAFYGCSYLKTIRKIVCYQGVNLYRVFRGCTELENIAWEGIVDYEDVDLASCTKLTKASISSTFSVLSTTANGLTVTFSKAAVDKAFETSDGANDGSTSPEWLALVATRQNVTIALA